MLITCGFFTGLISLIFWELTPVGKRFTPVRTFWQVLTFLGIAMCFIGFILHATEGL